MNNNKIKEVEKRRFRKYLWSGNVKEHGDTVMKYAIYSSAIAGTVSLAAFAAIGALADYEPTQRAYAVMAVVFCWLAVWVLMFGVMTISYATLIAMQIESVDSPTLPRKERETVVYEREGKQTRLLKRTIK